MRLVYLLAGLLATAIGAVGVFVPLLPTVPFLLVAAWCFARSSRRLEIWLRGNRWFGPALEDWEREGAISVRAKTIALASIALGYVGFLIGSRPGPALGIPVTLVLVACVGFILTRPVPEALDRRGE